VAVLVAVVRDIAGELATMLGEHVEVPKEVA
jgi:hypothetical protein